MSAYVIGDIEVTNQAIYDDYRKQVLATVEKFGGKFVARGGKTEPLEGGWTTKRLVMIEFPTLEQALKWYRSPEYAPLISLRQKGARGRLIAVEGV